jgi:hypothetical protein
MFDLKEELVGWKNLRRKIGDRLNKEISYIIATNTSWKSNLLSIRNTLGTTV